MNDFSASANSWYTRTQNADGTYTYTAYRSITTFPAESVELYCGWNMKRLTQAVCNDCNRKMGMSDYVNVNNDTKTLDFLFLERDVSLYPPDGRLYYYTEESRNRLLDAFNVALEYLVDLTPNSTKNIMFDYSLKEGIEQAAVGIYDALNQMAFNPADYSKVEAQIARVNQIREGTFVHKITDSQGKVTEIKDCGINTFTAATWRQVEVAEGKVKYDYDTTQQAAVDIFASNIDEAISGLMLKSDVEDWSPLVEVLNEYAKSFTECETLTESITLKGATYELYVSKVVDGKKLFNEAFDQDLLDLADEYFRSARELLTDDVDATTFDLDETVAVLWDLINEIKSTEKGGDYAAIIGLWNDYLSSNTTPYKLELRQKFVEAYKAVDWTLTESQQADINKYYTNMYTIYSQMTSPNNLDKFEISVDDGKDASTQNTVLNVSYGTPIIDLLTTPTRNGYKFGGWFIDENCTMPVGDMVATYKTKVYALWLEDTP